MNGAPGHEGNKLSDWTREQVKRHCKTIFGTAGLRIPLPSRAIDLLTQWQTEAPEGIPFVLLTKERYEPVKAKWQQVQAEGRPWKNRYLVNNVLRNFKNHVKQAGTKPIGKLTVHTLRKCCGQNWADHLPMNVVKELMGHNNTATTQEFYTTVDRGHERRPPRSFRVSWKRAKVTYT